MLIAGGASIVAGFIALGYVLSYWSANQFAPIVSVLPAVLGTLLLVIGSQNVLGGFMLSILNGNEADFMKAQPAVPARASVPVNAVTAPLSGEPA